MNKFLIVCAIAWLCTEGVLVLVDACFLLGELP